ncbi:MAG: SCP2 sterol-binding domain-containing protein [Chloroflexi bacterium]|nr:SCP2 sterol-binding domain-containing protein [Chloroflexota bacterium]
MAHPFPSAEWLKALEAIVNSDPRYAEVAKNWEGDLIFDIQPDAGEQAGGGSVRLYLDLWHGTCRGSRVLGPEDSPKAKFTLRAPRANFLNILGGGLDPCRPCSPASSCSMAT